MNPPQLETKQSEPCPYSFKCLNCKGDHQADLNLCPFWKHCFNREWHSKKYQELWEVRKQLICSVVSDNQAWLSRIPRSCLNKEHVPTKRYTIIKISEEKDKFIAELINNIKRLDTENLTSKFTLNWTVQRFADKSDDI